MRSVFICSVSLFSLSTAIHLALWRLRLPRNRPLALVTVFIFLPIALVAMAAGVQSAPPAEHLLAALLLDLALAASYVLTYPAVEALSPSLLIVLKIGSSADGLPEKDLAEGFGDELLLYPRVRDLIDSGMLKESGGGLTLSPSAKLMIRFFTAYRRFIGLPHGEG
ncbi:MAG TPA: hypothetical protein DDW94_05665 [Deltaproteobacteria bacterium]|nr:MAG: hypothetical protein A2Z79_04280 [Deltaproteobacteria bacterium GWA2_55_82]OGQ64143.1 MAG: hypothetical protein A3I81_10665 [Deltaproteobacteria bacterium RIFCSPLOWO2_02_FULL_55_12]OIJ74595.1 MAG: hypothetical protein A2V21_310190 [Deltaproteobacteria bacterium GWC2_55_46]HBG46462.1 hypothetical protein [Deltaproteobacteria bacterium]HCY10674.1 hypothetical protein [Deltaproteobacteria bacterium]